jgi:hypothetical protein
VWLPFSGILLFPILSIWFFVVKSEPVTLWRVIWIHGGLIFFGLAALPFYLLFFENRRFYRVIGSG